MRLIDADELIKSLKSACKPELCTDCGSNWCKYNCPKNDYIDLIANAPTVDTTCSNCDYRKFTETFINGVVDVMNKNDITNIEQLTECLRGFENRKAVTNG